LRCNERARREELKAPNEPVSRALPRPVYTLDEAARLLRKGGRWLRIWLADHPSDALGEPFYSPLGRNKTLDDGDIARIRAAERHRLPKSRPHLFCAAKSRTFTGISHGRSRRASSPQAVQIPPFTPKPPNCAAGHIQRRAKPVTFR
jgi:hypothetical protein